MSATEVPCGACGFVYNPLTEVTCPACTSGHVMRSLPVGVSPVDPRAAARARAAVEYAEKQLLRERQLQAATRSLRRRDRRIGAFQVAFGIPLAVIGLMVGPRLAVVPVYGPIIQWAPVMFGVGIAIIGVLRMLKAPVE